jgi:hypothetical protein
LSGVGLNTGSYPASFVRAFYVMLKPGAARDKDCTLCMQTIFLHANKMARKNSDSELIFPTCITTGLVQRKEKKLICILRLLKSARAQHKKGI